MEKSIVEFLWNNLLDESRSTETIERNIRVFQKAIEMENKKQKNIYSEKEVLNIIDNFCERFKVDLILRKDFNEWFEEFKKK